MSRTMDVNVTGIGVVAPDGAGRPWFDTHSRLGPRGYKYVPAAGQYVLAATRDAVADGGRLDRVPAERRGAALGTNYGLAAVIEHMDRTVADGHADDLSPASAPFFAINVLGTRLAAEHEVKGFQLTVTSPRVAGLEAIEVGLRALALGRCSVLLAAAMEDGPSADTVEQGAVEQDTVEQGAAALVFEASAASVGPYGSCRVRTAFVPPHLVHTRDGRGRLGSLVTGMIADLGAHDLPVHAVLDDSTVSEAVGTVVRTVGVVRSLTTAGNGCLAPMLRLAGLLTERIDCLLVTATAEGNVAMAKIIGPGSLPC